MFSNTSFIRTLCRWGLASALLIFAALPWSVASAATTTMVAQHSGKCLDVIGGNGATGNGVQLEQWTCVTGANNQQFTTKDMGGGQFEIIASHSGKCVGPVNGGTVNGTYIEQRDCVGSPQQLWSIKNTGVAGMYQVISAPSGRCLDVIGGDSGLGDGVMVELWDCAGSANQTWAMAAPVVTPPAAVVAKHSGKCLDVIGGNTGTANGTRLEQWTCYADADNQKFTFKFVGNGQYEVIAKHSGRCVEVVDGSVADGAPIDQWDCSGAPKQLWKLNDVSGGYKQIISVVSNKCLDVTGGGSGLGDGVPMEQWTCVTGADNQTWTIGGTGPATPPSGTVVNAADCSASAVQAAVDAAPAGATVQIPAGDCNWGTAQVNVNKGVYLRGAGKANTILRRVGSVAETAYLVKFNCAGFGSGERAAFSDITLVGNDNAGIYDKGLGLFDGCVDFKVFNSKFTHFVFAAVEVNGSVNQRGVIYQNDFIDNYNNNVRNLGYGVVVYGDGSRPPLVLGMDNPNAVFVEDNYMSGNRHHIASNNSSRYVFRYNNVIATDVTKDFAMTDAHGLSSSPAGSRSWEIYNNTYSGNLSSGAVYAAIAMRGGDGVIFNNNIATGLTPRPVALDVEGNQCGSYPATDQIRQAWIWNNSISTIAVMCSANIQQDRDFFTYAKSGYTPYTYPHPLRSQ